MKKMILVFGLIILLVPACKKQTELINTDKEEQQLQQPPSCGMEIAMANLSPDIRNAMTRSAGQTNMQAAELLIFLDFDGAVVRPGFPNPTGLTSTIISGVRNCPAAPLTPTQIAGIVELVRDDYSPFKIQVTTDQAVFDTYTAVNKEICIVTTVPSVIGMPSGFGGVAPFAGLGLRLPFNPSFVFSSLYGGDLADIAMTISHETGHTLGLGHQSFYNDDCGFIFDYHMGFGTGPISFAPIMGGGSKRVSNWYAQSCIHPFYGGPQNDFVFINNQVDLKEDDFPDSPTGSTINGNEINGILEQAGDVDFMRINFKNPGPVTISSENIDLKVSVYNSGGHLMEEYNDPDDTGVTIPSVNGNRYLKIEAVSNTNMSFQFMTGKYKVTY